MVKPPPDMNTPLRRADQVLVNASIALVSAWHAESWRPVLVQAIREALPRVTADHPMVAPLAEAARRYLDHVGTKEGTTARIDMDRALVQLACWRLGHVLEGAQNG